MDERELAALLERIDKADSAGDIREAQQQLGHSSVVMTEHYVRNRRGAKVTPTR